MRARNRISKVSDIVKNPALRVEFPLENHQDFIDFSNIADTYKINMTNFGRHVWLVWMRKFAAVSDNEFKSKMIGEVIQSMHGITQTDIFSKYETFENIGGPKNVAEEHQMLRNIAQAHFPYSKVQTRVKNAMKKVKKKNPLAFKKKAVKK